MATYYINASTGNDTTGTGTALLPWQTLAKAITSSTTNDTIVCQAAAATYAWVTQSIAGRTIQAATLGDAIFDGAGAHVVWTLSLTNVITKIIFQNAIQTSSSRIFQHTATNGYSFTYNNCIFRNTTIRGGTGSVDGLFGRTGNGATTETWAFNNCAIYNIDANTANRAQIIGIRELRGTLSIYNCVYYNDESGTAIPAAFIDTIFVASSLAISIVNSIFKSVNSHVFRANAGTAVETVNYNDFNNFTATISGTGNITTDPLFVDAANGNFNLRPTSPAINAGVLV